MSRAVYIGGFGNGEVSAGRVAEAIGSERNFEDVDQFTFAEAIENTDRVAKAVKGVSVLTHSAGMLALPGTRPQSIEAFSPPLPTSKLRLVGKTLIKTARMHTPGIGMKPFYDVLPVARYDADSGAEVRDYLKRRALGGYLNQIIGFDAARVAATARVSDIPTTLSYTNGDEYYKLSSEQERMATLNWVNVLHAPGVHDELVLRPAETLRQFQLADDTN